MLVFHMCLFPYESSNFYMVALTFVDYVFQAGCWGSFLGRLDLTCWWILFIQMDWSLRCLGGYLATVMVFFDQLKVDST